MLFVLLVVELEFVLAFVLVVELAFGLVAVLDPVLVVAFELVAFELAVPELVEFAIDAFVPVFAITLIFADVLILSIFELIFFVFIINHLLKIIPNQFSSYSYLLNLEFNVFAQYSNDNHPHS